MILENEKCDEIEHSCPKHSLERGKHLGGNNGRYGIGCIVKTIDIIEDDRQCYDNDQECGHSVLSN